MKKKNKIKINGKPKNIIEKIIEEFKFKIPKSLPPISSILSGYFSYDIIRYVEKIPDSCKDDLKIPDSRIIRPRTLIIYDNLKKKIYFIINCFADEKIRDYSKKYLKIKNEIKYLIFLANYKSNIQSKKKLTKISIKSNISKKKFLSNVNIAKKYIKIGDIFQVVLSQRFEAKLTKSPLEIYKKLRIKNPSPFMYFFNFDDFQIIGASPEILVRLRDGTITLRPIAGTRPRGKNKKEDLFYEKDLLKDKKELAEHLMLLDLGRNDTGKVSKINSVKVTEQFKIERYSHVMHIVSNVIGKFNNKFTNFDTLLSGFPAGTVSGAPKIRSMEIIDELENTKRKVYAGGIGYFSANGDFDTCIALRTAVSKNNKFYVQAGAGIVADSKPINEYYETVNKAKALLKAIE
jgi:anthranilate synthase component 1